MRYYVDCNYAHAYKSTGCELYNKEFETNVVWQMLQSVLLNKNPLKQKCYLNCLVL